MVTTRQADKPVTANQEKTLAVAFKQFVPALIRKK